MVALVRAALRARLATPTAVARRHFAAASVANLTPGKSIQPIQETIPQKVLRWADFFGFITRWYCRKAWVLDMEPEARIRLQYVTEYERYMLIWGGAMCTLFWPFCIYFFYGQFSHMQHKPPMPLHLAHSYLNNRKTDFHWSGGMYQLCRDCRGMEYECKKECVDELRAVGFSHRRSDAFRYPMTQAFGPS